MERSLNGFDMANGKIAVGRLAEVQVPLFIKAGFSPEDVVDVKFYPPAVKMFFRDGTVTTASAKNGDVYNPEIGMMVCIMKYAFGNNTYNNFFRKWMKVDKARQEAKAEARKIEEEVLAAEKKRREKKEAWMKKVAAKQKEYEIEVLAEAIRRAGVCPTMPNDCQEDDGK